MNTAPDLGTHHNLMMLSKEAFTQGGQFPKNLTRQSLWSTPGRRPWEAYLSENGGFIGRLVLLLLLGCSFLHLLPVCLLFPVSSLWLQMQSTGVRLVQNRQRRLLAEDPGLSGGPQSLHTRASQGREAQAGCHGQDSSSLTSQTSNTWSSCLEPFPSEGTQSPLPGPATRPHTG